MTGIRFMTFNVHGSNWPKDGPNSWAERGLRNVSVILGQAPDVIGFQEAQAGNLHTYRESLFGYDHVPGNCYGNNPPNEHTAIFWKSDRFDLVDSGEFWFSPTPDAPSTGWGVAYPMGATWVTLRERLTAKEFVFLNTHFEDGPDGAESRRESARLIVARMKAMAGVRLAVILAGDFNYNPGGEAHAIFRSAGYVDTFLAAGHQDGQESTYHGYEGDAYDARRYSDGANTYWRIDWIMVRQGAGPVRVLSSEIVRDANPPLYPSDHYPVIADLQL